MVLVRDYGRGDLAQWEPHSGPKLKVFVRISWGSHEVFIIIHYDFMGILCGFHRLFNGFHYHSNGDLLGFIGIYWDKTW